MSSSTSATVATARPTLWGHIQTMRIDHWVKNVFVLPGIVVALEELPSDLRPDWWWPVLIGVVSVCLVASSNYTINELLDAPFDRLHPTKHLRPVPSGQVNIPLAYVQWILLFIAGMGAALLVSIPFALTMAALWIMGCIYNVPPVRSKDLPYLDVLSEAINNPLRMLAGWYMITSRLAPPGSLLMSYWMVGCYFMAIKRFAEYRNIGNRATSAAYRKSFACYDEKHLLISIMFYAAHAMLFFGAFVVRYRMELILSFPLVAWVMCQYLAIGFKPDGGAERPEHLYKERGLMVSVISCAAVLIVLMFVRLPQVTNLFNPLTRPH